MRIGIYSYGPSDSTTILRDSLIESGFDTTRKLMSDGTSAFRGRSEDIVINYGSSAIDDVNRATHNGTVINQPEAVNRAANKVVAFTKLEEAGICVPYFTSSAVDAANQMLLNNLPMFARTELRAHSGEGIIYVAPSAPEHLGAVDFSSRLPTAPLYTGAITGDRHEYRVHVAFGEVILLQQKRRRNGWRDNEDYSDVVRNHGNGWIYATSNVGLPPLALADCIDSVRILGLDFGAVDIVVKEGEHWVLEVNTAPGLQGDSSRSAYTEAFGKFLYGNHSEEATLSQEGDTFGEWLTAATSEDSSDSQETPVDTAAAISSTGTSMFNTSWGWPPSVGGETTIASTPPEGSTEEIERPSVEGVDRALAELLEAQNQRISEGVRAAPLTATMPNLDFSAPPQNIRVSRAGSSAEASPRRANPLSSEVPPTELVSAVNITGPGHYVVELSEGVRTVALKMETGELYSADHDLFLQEADVAIISKINL